MYYFSPSNVSRVEILGEHNFNTENSINVYVEPQNSFDSTKKKKKKKKKKKLKVALKTFCFSTLFRYITFFIYLCVLFSLLLLTCIQQR